MVAVAIASVEAVFDWKAYLRDTYGYEVDDSGVADDFKAESLSADDFEAQADVPGGKTEA